MNALAIVQLVPFGPFAVPGAVSLWCTGALRCQIIGVIGNDNGRPYK